MFKPKNQKEQQPFYLSWFTNQGENLKRGGTAPNESRKERLAFKSPYQQPLTSLIHVGPNPYQKGFQAPKQIGTNIQQISKIYQGPQKSFNSKRKSQEYGRNRYDVDSRSGRSSLQPSRTFTQQNGKRPTQQFRPATQQKTTLEQKIPCEKIVNYYPDEEENDQMTPREDEEMEEIQNIQFDDDENFSNKSEEAESEGQRSIHLPTKNEEINNEMLKNKSFVQKQDEEQITSLRKTTNSINRPQTSEGARRKRFQNSLTHSEEPVKMEKKDTEYNILECHPIKEEEFENMMQLDEFDKVQVPTNISSPKELISIRSGQRRKQLEQQTVSSCNNRPPSRHKTPPKATGLEMPNGNPNNDNEIPIKNMYAQIEQRKMSANDENFDDLVSETFKMNNKFTFQTFQKDKDEYKQSYQSESETCNVQTKHPQSANLKSNKGTINQNASFSPMTASKPNTSHLLRLTEPQTEIVIKYNNNTAASKNTSQPVKVPFQTSLGQDFLRLFANNYID